MLQKRTFYCKHTLELLVEWLEMYSLQKSPLTDIYTDSYQFYYESYTIQFPILHLFRGYLNSGFWLGKVHFHRSTTFYSIFITTTTPLTTFVLPPDYPNRNNRELRLTLKLERSSSLRFT